MQVAARIKDVVGDQTQEGSFADEIHWIGEHDIRTRHWRTSRFSPSLAESIFRNADVRTRITKEFARIPRLAPGRVKRFSKRGNRLGINLESSTRSSGGDVCCPRVLRNRESGRGRRLETSRIPGRSRVYTALFGAPKRFDVRFLVFGVWSRTSNAHDIGTILFEREP